MMLNSSLKRFFTLYFSALVICMSARVYLKLNAMDPLTGFYVDGGALVPAFNAVFGICIVALFLLYVFRRTDRDYPVLRSDKFTAFLALLTGVTIALYQVEAMGVSELAFASPGVLLEGLPLTISAAIGGLSALVFVVIGARALFGDGQMYGGVFSLIAGIWLMITLVFKFNSYTTLTTISDNLLTVLFMVFCALFLTGHARTLGGLSRRDGRNYAIPAGLSASLCGLLLVVPNWVWMAMNGTLHLPAPMLGNYESLFIFFMSVYALLFVRHICLSMRAV